MKAEHVPPVVPADKIQLAKDALKAISDAQAVILKLEACGENCQHYRDLSAHYDAKLRTLIHHFGAMP